MVLKYAPHDDDYLVCIEFVNIKNGKFHDKLATKVSLEVDHSKELKTVFKTIKGSNSDVYERV